jgi:hypothetical protein
MLERRRLVRHAAAVAALALLSGCAFDGGDDDDRRHMSREPDVNPPGPKGGPGTNQLGGQATRSGASSGY